MHTVPATSGLRSMGPTRSSLPQCACLPQPRSFPSGARSFKAWIALIALLIAPLSHAQLDTNALRASARTPAGYESGRSLGDRMGYTGPEGSGRPGVYFFKKAAKAFERGQYAFAIDMYEASASWAYKPAQYNLSVMYSRGQGVPVDLPRAMAWIALAAERGDPNYVAARDAMNAGLDSEQVAEANRILLSLKGVYADATALKRARHRWRDAKLDATGSRLGFTGGLKVGAAGNSLAGHSPGYEGSTAWELTSGRQNDASIEYRQLQESAGPYEPSDRVVTGTATVGEIQPIRDPGESRPDEAGAERDSDSKQ